jgi:hypothetical protein
MSNEKKCPFVRWRTILKLVIALILPFSKPSSAQEELDPPIITNVIGFTEVAWASDSQRFVYARAGAEMPLFSEPLWRQYDIQSQELASASFWPLQPTLTAEEITLFRPEGFVYTSPNGQFLLFAQRDAEQRFVFALANRIQPQVVALHWAAGYSSPDVTQPQWSDDSLHLSVSFNYDGEQTTFYADIRNPDDLLTTQVYEFSELVNGVTYTTFDVLEDKLYDLSPDGEHILLVGREFIPGDPYAAPSQLIVWSPLSPTPVRFLHQFDPRQIKAAGFAPGSNTQLLLADEAQGLLYYDLMTGQTTSLLPKLASSPNYLAWFSPNTEWIALFFSEQLRFLNVGRLVEANPNSSIDSHPG